MKCFHPQEIRTPDGSLQLVKCGYCLACLQHRQSEWIVRLSEQAKCFPDSTYFTTLTYDEEHLPVNEVFEDSDDLSEGAKPRLVPTVRKRDLIKFHADLRKRFSQGFYYDQTLFRNGFAMVPDKIELPKDVRFSYYCTSEYGPEGGRPHYHGIYFGLPEDPDLVFDLFQQIWGKGFIYAEKAKTDKAPAYVAKYLVNDSLVPHDPKADRCFSLMSKGLGKSYLTPSMLEWHRADLNRAYIPSRNGGRLPLPRYYRLQIFDDEMRAVQMEGKLERDNYQLKMEASLSEKELWRREEQRIRKEKEAVRQAVWRFQKSGKIK